MTRMDPVEMRPVRRRRTPATRCWYEGRMETTAATEVVGICRDLLRIDTTNTGDQRTTVGERVAAEYVAGKLSEVGVEYELHESAPTRANLVARIPGADRERGALLVHGHLDV